MASALSDRELGQYSLSIATSLAMESLNNMHPDLAHDHIPAYDYEELWVNMRTMFRNIIGAVPTDKQHTLRPGDIAEVMLAEMQCLRDMAKNNNAALTVQFYVSEYSNLERKYPLAKVRVDSTERQKWMTTTMTAVIDGLMKHLRENNKSLPSDHKDRIEPLIFNFDLKPKTKKRTVIITHIPLDLTWANNFGSLDLLESHTGAIKKSTEWYTKFMNGKTLPMIPFNRAMLQIFGDHEMFSPWKNTNREQIVELATKSKWMQHTTTSRIAFCLQSLRDHYVRERVKSLL